MAEPIVDSDDSYWTVYGAWGDDGNDVCIGIRDNGCRDDVEPPPPFVSHDHGGSHHDGDTLLILNRANATRLAIALATALAAKPVPIDDEQLELPFADPPWQRDQPQRH